MDGSNSELDNFNQEVEEIKQGMTQQGCFRKENCQYHYKEGMTENNTESVKGFNCDYCSFTSAKKIIMYKHLNIKDGYMDSVETVYNSVQMFELFRDQNPHSFGKT